MALARASAALMAANALLQSAHAAPVCVTAYCGKVYSKTTLLGSKLAQTSTAGETKPRANLDVDNVLSAKTVRAGSVAGRDWLLDVGSWDLQYDANGSCDVAADVSSGVDGEPVARVDRTITQAGAAYPIFTSTSSTFTASDKTELVSLAGATDDVLGALQASQLFTTNRCWSPATRASVVALGEGGDKEGFAKLLLGFLSSQGHSAYARFGHLAVPWDAASVSHYSFEDPRGQAYALLTCPDGGELANNLVTGAARVDAAVVVVNVAKPDWEQFTRDFELAKSKTSGVVVVAVGGAQATPEQRKAFESTALEYSDIFPVLRKGVESSEKSYEALFPELARRGAESSKIFAPEVYPLVALGEGTDGLESVLAVLANAKKGPRSGATGKNDLLVIGIMFSAAAPPPSDGTVAADVFVTGRVESGAVVVDPKAEYLVLGGPKTLKATVTGIEMFRKILDRGEAGDNVGLLLRGIEKSQIKRGMVLAAPGGVKPATAFVATVYMLKKEEGGRHTPFHNKYRPQIYFRTTDVAGEIELPAGRMEVMPGDNVVNIKVKLIVPVAMDKGLRFAIREGGRTVGAGQVTEIIQ